MNLTQKDIDFLQSVIQEAGEIILSIYHTDFDVDYKADESPLTIADQKANDLLVKRIQERFPTTEFITEETKAASYEERKNWEFIWIIDPLDGTKEFVKKNGEFTVNIALAHQHEIIFGMILVPVTGELYYAQKDKGAYKVVNGETIKLLAKQPTKDELIVVASRSHRSQEVDDYVESFASKYDSIQYRAAGSSLKLCLVAEGKAHVYPRLGPTMEWDTAAGHIIATESGATIYRHDNHQPLLYNKEDLLNPYFIVSAID